MDPYESVPHRRGCAVDSRETHAGEIDCSVQLQGQAGAVVPRYGCTANREHSG